MYFWFTRSQFSRILNGAASESRERTWVVSSTSSSPYPSLLRNAQRNPLFHHNVCFVHIVEQCQCFCHYFQLELYNKMKSFQTRKYHWLTKKITSPYTSEKKTTTSFPGSWKWGCGNGCERLELLTLLISKMAEASSSTSHSNPSNPVVFFDIAIGGQVKTSFCFSFQLLNVKLKVLFKHRTTFYLSLCMCRT